LENLSDNEDINRAWKNVKENIKTSSKDSVGLHELQQRKLWFDEEFDVCTVHCWVVHKNQHCALSFVNVFITNAAPTCFGTYVPSSGSVFVLVST
jgi:hypothetical protein